MKLDSLRSFYASPTGQAVSADLRSKVERLWGDLRGERILLQVGYGVPYVDSSSVKYERILSVLPDIFGEGFRWDMGDGNISCCSGIYDLPFGDMSVDNIMVVHVLEFCDDIDLLLSEFWRVLVGGGRLLLVVPLRYSFWGRFGLLPFGCGRFFGFWDLRRSLGRNFFMVEGFEFGFHVSLRGLFSGGFMVMDCRKVLGGDDFASVRVRRGVSVFGRRHGFQSARSF